MRHHAGPPPQERHLATYAFLTTFEVGAPPDDVFDLVVRPEPWLAAWGDLVTVERRRAPDEGEAGGALAGEVRAPLGYRVGGRIDIVEARRPSYVRMRVAGTIAGTGTWSLEPTAAGTAVALDWRVRPVAGWLRVMTPLARPVLEAGHEAVVRHAVDAAAAHLGVPVLAFSSTARR